MMLVPATLPHRNQRRILNSEAITSTIFLGEERLMKEVGERSSVVFKTLGVFTINLFHCPHPTF